mgnify:FL=1
MKRQLRIILIVIIAAVAATAIIFAVKYIKNGGEFLTPVGTRAEFIGDTKKYPSELLTKGNAIYDSDGEKVMLRGVEVPESHELYKEKRFKKDFYDGVFKLGGNAIRVPVSPAEYKRDDYYLWRYLDRIVAWAGENGNYVIIDWDYTGNPIDGTGDEMPDIKDNPLDYSAEFWKAVATYFKNVPNVIYEIYNEPVGMSDSEWKRCADSLVSVIRDAGSKQLIIVGSPDYCYDLGWLDELGVDDDNIAFSMHVYPDRVFWQKYMPEYVSSYPVIVTEWGYADDDVEAENEKMNGTKNVFGIKFSHFMDKHESSWIASSYNYKGDTPMFEKNFKGKTKWGEFVSELLE